MAFIMKNKQSNKSNNHSINTFYTNSLKSPESLISIESPESLISFREYNFSFFKRPITNKYSYKDISLFECYQLIKTNFKKSTEYLRKIDDKEKYREEKKRLLHYVTFAGTFEKRESKSLSHLSGLMCLDLDHITNLSAKKRKLISDPLFEVLMVFTSPGGDGLKVIIVNPFNEDYSNDYKKIDDHVWRRYGLKIDHTSDVARACFLCHDPDVWIANHLQQDTSEIESKIFLKIKEFPEASHLNYNYSLSVSGYYDRLLEVLNTS